MNTPAAIGIGLAIAFLVLSVVSVFVFDPFGAVPGACWGWLE